MSTDRLSLTLRQKMDVARLIEPVIKDCGDGTFEYLPAHSDKTIAQQATEQLGFEVNVHTAKRIRQEAFGHLKRGGPMGSGPKLREDLDAAIGLINDLSTQIGSLSAIVTGQRQQINDLREITEDLANKADARLSGAKAELRRLVGHHDRDWRQVQTQMRASGYTDEEIGRAMILTGAEVLNHGTQKPTVRLPRAIKAVS